MKLLNVEPVADVVRRTTVATATLCAALFGTAANAQIAGLDEEPSARDPGVEIMRPAEDLSDVLRTHPVDRDFINTALVITDAGGRDSVAYCVAYNQRGEPVGRGYTKIPGNGVRVVFASDLSNGVDFLGKIRCKSRGLVSGTAFIIGPEFSDTRVHNTPLPERSGSLLNVPVAISR